MRTRLSAIVIGAALLAGCGGDSSNPSEVLSPGDLPAGEMTFGLRHLMTKNGVRTAILESDTAFQQQNGREFDLRGVYLQFFGEAGTESGTLTSRSGEYTPADGSFVARDSVVLITLSPKGTRVLETEELYYDVRTEEVWSDSAFVLNDAGTISRGKSFRSDVHGGNWTTTGLVTEDVATGGAGTF